MGDKPRTHALAALMLFNAARLSARTDSAGNVLRLREQDRSSWDKGMIARGMLHLQQSAAGDDLSEYHLQAAIAACHCAAPDHESTDWAQILRLYNRLIQINPSPVVALNRAVAVAEVHGPGAGIAAVEAIQARDTLNSYYLLYAVLAEFESQLDHFRAAAENLRTAIKLTEIRSEKNLLSKRLAACEKKIAPKHK